MAIVSPFPPPYGGMAVQAEKLCNRLVDEGFTVDRIIANPRFPSLLSGFEKIPVIRTVVRFIIFARSLNRIRSAGLVHILAASHLYFFVVVVPTILFARFFGKRTILNYRGGEAEVFFIRWRGIVRPFVKMAHLIAVPSPFLQDVFSRYFNVSTHILPNLADLESFSFVERKTVQPVLIVSRQLERIYNHECILRAFSLIKNSYPHAKLNIAGAGSEEGRLRELVDQLDLQDVIFLGALTHDQLARVYDESSIMVNASLADNFPGSLLEAFMCGLPVVTTSVGGIPWMVKHEVSGLLVSSDDHVSLAAAVEKLIECPDLAFELARNARQKAESYRWEEIKKVLFSLYEESSTDRRATN